MFAFSEHGRFSFAGCVPTISLRETGKSAPKVFGALCYLSAYTVIFFRLFREPEKQMERGGNGDPYGNRTHVNGVRGRCLNRLTNGPCANQLRGCAANIPYGLFAVLCVIWLYTLLLRIFNRVAATLRQPASRLRRKYPFRYICLYERNLAVCFPRLVAVCTSTWLYI